MGKRTEFADCPMIVRAVEAGGFVRSNAAFRARFGFSDRELAERPLAEWIDPDDHAAFQAAIDRGEGSCRVGHRMRSGEFYPVDLRMTDQGEGVMVLGRADVATQPDRGEERADDTVLGTLETIAHIVEEQNPGYKCSILLVADGRFVRGAGPSLPEAYNAAVDGYAIGPTVGACGTAIYWNVPVIVEDIQADPLWASLAKLAREAGVAACWSHPFVSRSGRVLGALALYSPVPRAPTAEQLSGLRAATAMTGLAVERGRAEEALREKRKRELELEDQLRQAAKMEALGVLAGGVAHDFNNVLATILSNAEFALQLLSDNEAVAEMLEDVVSASRRAGGFCKQMLAYAGRGTPGTTRIEIGTLLPQLSSLVQAALSKKASLEYSLHEEAMFVEGDENQLLQVIMNLVTNAADALGEDEGEIVVGSELVSLDAETLSRIEPGADLPAGQYVRLTVCDNGMGMNAETVGRVFDPFYTTKLAGHGLGLAAVKGIVRGHRGVILIESELGTGTKATVLLPTTAAPAVADGVSVAAARPRARKRVLVAEDEKDFRTILCRMLKHSGFDVVAMADGQLAIDAFREDPASIDCVLLDLSMPKRSGAEVLKELRRIRPDVPIVLMSGYNEDEMAGRFEGAKISGFLQKPVPAVDLLAMLSRATGADAAA